MSVALIGNYPPRRCGIATFTADIVSALGQGVLKQVVAMSDGMDASYGAPVTQVVRQEVLDDYIAAADALEDVDVVCLQHEFGIFGGVAGEHVLALLERLDCPVVTTLHTVLREPNDDQLRVLGAIARRSARMIVMSEFGRRTLEQTYRVPAEKIVVTPHGAPDRPFVAPDTAKPAVGLEGRRVLLTFGLLSPNKGIETAIASLPALRDEFPDVLYVILGATHPHLVRKEGDAYFQQLRKLAADLGVSEHVRFEHRYADDDELIAYLTAADIYVTPYRHEAQVTSGTLAYALALGKPVVSTPYWHARELLDDGVGKLIGFDDPADAATAIGALLREDGAREAMARRAYDKGREATWPRIGEAYRTAFAAAIRSEKKPTRRSASGVTPSLAAVARMTDDCGILQHAIGVIPDRAHGYCLDDAARALILMHRAHAVGVRGAAARRIAHACAALVGHAWNEGAGEFRNFMSYDRRWLEDAGSPDSQGRAFWALGETVRAPIDPALAPWALELTKRATPLIPRLTPLRSRAFCVLGAGAPARFAERAPEFRSAILDHIAVLHDALRRARRPGWSWFEAGLTYDNARLPEALLTGSQITGSTIMREDALDALAWLAGMQTGPGGVFHPQGNAGFDERYGAVAPYDQQPLEAAAMADACALAFRITGEREWSAEATRAWGWFIGQNTRGERLIDDDGGCFDGLHADGVSINQGAESIVSAQLAACALTSIQTLHPAAQRA